MTGQVVRSGRSQSLGPQSGPLHWPLGCLMAGIVLVSICTSIPWCSVWSLMQCLAQWRCPIAGSYVGLIPFWLSAIDSWFPLLLEKRKMSIDHGNYYCRTWRYTIKQVLELHFSSFSVHRVHLGFVVNAVSDSVVPGAWLRLCISRKLLGCAVDAGVRTTMPWGAKLQKTCRAWWKKERGLSLHPNSYIPTLQPQQGHLFRAYFLSTYYLQHSIPDTRGRVADKVPFLWNLQ